MAYAARDRRWKVEKPGKGLLGGRGKFKVAHFRHLFRNSILQQIIVPI